jgi:hypothetical protein
MVFQNKGSPAEQERYHETDVDSSAAVPACIADARPAAECVGYLEEAGLTAVSVEPPDEALSHMVREIQGKLLSAELMVKLRKLELPGADIEHAKRPARSVLRAVT